MGIRQIVSQYLMVFAKRQTYLQQRKHTMANAKETLSRLLTVLSLIPEEPRFTSTATLEEKLKELGYLINRRSIQRDLNELSVSYSLQAQKDGNRNLWSYTKGAVPSFHHMDTATALTLELSRKHLKSILPQSVYDLMAPRFNQAAAQIVNLEENLLSNWTKRVRTLSDNKCLLPAQVDSEIWERVSYALLHGKQIEATYLARGKDTPKRYKLHPAGLISRPTTNYLIASVKHYTNVVQYSLHRFQHVEVLDEDTQKHSDFDIDHFIEQKLNSDQPILHVELIADITADLAWLLNENPLSEIQNIQPLEGGQWFRLQATVPDDLETRRWVYGLGETIRVHQPKAWRNEIIERLAKAQALYQ